MDHPLAGTAAALCVAFTVLTALVAVVSTRSRRRHQAQLGQWAAAQGWAYEPRPDVSWGALLPGGNRHGVQEAFTALFGDRPVTVAEYSVTDATSNTTFHVLTVAALHRPRPAIQVRPRGRLSRAGRPTGNPGFDRAFRVTTADGTPQLPPAVVDAQLTGRVPPTWTVSGNEVLHWQPGRLDPADLNTHAAAILHLAELLDGPG